MPSYSHPIKKDLNNMRSVSEFKQTYKQVAQEMIAAEKWTPEEKDAMHLFSAGHAPGSIRNQIQLSDESSKKIADMYFMILLNTLIRNQTPMPFKLPAKEIDSWPASYSRDQFAADLLKHKKQLNTTPVGKEVMRAASEYTSLYESTVGKTSAQGVNNSEKSESSPLDKAATALGVLWGVADGLAFSPSNPFPSTHTMSSESARTGYAAAVFAKGIFELGGLVASLSK